MAPQQINLSEIGLSGLPQKEAVYAIFAKGHDSGGAINCRYVGETDDLSERTKRHFTQDEQNACLREFMQSERTKLMIYELMPDSTEDERVAKEQEWIAKYKPKCNE
jgi:predicted GIY-YIG superfamily endonuclease